MRLLSNDAQPSQIQSLRRNCGSDGPDMDPGYRNIPGFSSRKMGLSESAERRPKAVSSAASVSAAPSHCHALRQSYTEMFWAETRDLGPPVVAPYEAAGRLAGRSGNVLTALALATCITANLASTARSIRCGSRPGADRTQWWNRRSKVATPISIKEAAGDGYRRLAC